MSDGGGVEGKITDEESSGESCIVCLYIGIEGVELFGVVNVCGGDGESGWEFGFRIDDYMEFVSVHVLFVDMIPAPACFWVIRVGFKDRAILDDGGDTEEFPGDELLNDLVEKMFEGVKADAFDEMGVVTDVWVVFESKLSSPEPIFFQEIMVVSVGFHSKEHKGEGEEHPYR